MSFSVGSVCVWKGPFYFLTSSYYMWVHTLTHTSYMHTCMYIYTLNTYDLSMSTLHIYIIEVAKYL